MQAKALGCTAGAVVGFSTAQPADSNVYEILK
jgi:hypothetical protein